MTDRYLKWHRLAVCGVFACASAFAAPADARTLTLCTLNWAPYYAEDLPRNGFFTALVEAAFERAGYETRVEFMPWARAMLEVEQGDREVLLGAYYTEERAETYLASDDIYTDEVGVIARSDIGFEEFDSLRDLSGYTIGVGRGFAVSEEFDGADYLDKEEGEDEVVNLRKFDAGRLDMMAGSFTAIRHAANENNFDLSDAVFLKPPLDEKSLHIMVSRAIDDGEEILDDFHQGLDEIRADGTYDEILEEMGQ